MTDGWRKAAQGLSDSERETALKNSLDCVGDTEAGIIRQLLGKDGKPLTEKQKYVYNNRIEMSLVEKCGRSGCSAFVPAGTNYCQTCEIEYGS